MRSAAEIALSAKTSAVTAVGTLASGFSTVVGLIPEDIGKLACLLSLVLTCVMIRYWSTQTKKSQIELELLIRTRDKPEAEN